MVGESLEPDIKESNRFLLIPGILICLSAVIPCCAHREAVSETNIQT